MKMLEYTVCSVKVSFMGFINYSYIVVDRSTKTAVIIDPAWNLDIIEEKLKQLNANPIAVLLTHSHIDHTNLADRLATKYDIRVFISKEEAAYFNCHNLSCLSDGSELCFGNTSVKCLLTPGHTTGSMCYLFDKAIFTGDTVFVEGVGMCSYDHAEDLFNSIQYLKKKVAPDVLVYPGHTYGKNVGCSFRYILNNNVYFLINEKEQFIDFRLREGQKNLFNFT